VMGHIGLTPQSVHRLGGYVVQGKDSEQAQQILKDARALEAAGCYAIVLECIPVELARIVTAQLRIPTIGIGAGPHVDGQVLVLNDLIGLDTTFTPKFAKRFAELGPAVESAVSAYVAEVRSRAFPAEQHGFHSPSVRLVPAPVEDDHEEPHGGVMGAPV